MGKNKVTSKDKGAEATQQALSQGLPQLDIGVLGSDASKQHGKATVGEIATFQEFGTKTIPPRPFISGWFQSGNLELVEAAKALAKKVASGDLTPEEFIELVGAKAVGEIQKYIANRVPPPLSPKTVARKGSSVPLIDTGVLRSSISYRAVKK